MPHVRRHLRQRLWSTDGDPGLLAWVVASISLVLPIVGLVLCLLGGIWVMRGDRDGWLWLGFGAAAIVLDILIDFVWAHPGVSASDQPDLNRRGAQLVGRTATVAETIEGRRGKVRIGDTVWPAEGPDAAMGATVRIVAVDTSVLVIEPFPGGEAAQSARSER